MDNKNQNEPERTFDLTNLDREEPSRSVDHQIARRRRFLRLATLGGLGVIGFRSIDLAGAQQQTPGGGPQRRGTCTRTETYSKSESGSESFPSYSGETLTETLTSDCPGGPTSSSTTMEYSYSGGGTFSGSHNNSSTYTGEYGYSNPNPGGHSWYEACYNNVATHGFSDGSHPSYTSSSSSSEEGTRVATYTCEKGPGMAEGAVEYTGLGFELPESLDEPKFAIEASPGLRMRERHLRLLGRK